MRYLDPRNDLTFRKIFGGHKDLCISLLNALLPLPDDEQIVSIEYDDPTMFPRTQDGKTSIVDVSCRDQKGRKFLVEMQMYWTPNFLTRCLFNAAKAFAGSGKRGDNFSVIQPVYSLCLINDSFLNKDIYKGEYLHTYRIRHDKFTELTIPGMTFVLVELSKFKSENRVHNKMAHLWLRFLTEIKDQTPASQVPQELAKDENIKKAIDLLEESSYDEKELAAYDKYWDIISINVTSLEDSYAEGEAKGLAKGLAEGRAEGKAEGMTEAKTEIARNMLSNGVDPDAIAKFTGLTIDEIKSL